MGDRRDDGSGGKGGGDDPPDTDPQPERAKLPPLAERLPPGEEGTRAFAALAYALIAAWAEKHGVRCEDQLEGPAGRPDLLAEGGLPGFEGPVLFRIIPSFHSADALSHGFVTLPSRAALRPETVGAPIFMGKFRHIVLVAPGEAGARALDAPRETGAKLSEPSAESEGAQVHSWGFAELEPLLRACPPLLARYYPEEAESAIRDHDGSTYSHMAQAHRAAVVTAFGPLRMVGVPTAALGDRDRQQTMSLASVFVPLRLAERARPDEVHAAVEMLENGSSCVVLGDPGTGKTTLLLFLALMFAGGATLPGYTPDGRLPLFVSLRELSAVRANQPGITVVDYLAQRARERDEIQCSQPALAAFFEAALRLGEAIVFFDGLDEVGADATRAKVAADVRAFQAKYARCAVWITSRKYGYAPKVALPEHFAHCLVAPLDADQIRDLVERWYSAREPAPGERRRLIAELQQAIERSPSVKRLAQNPLLLTLTALVHQTQKKLPRDRGELYEQCIEMLLKTWDADKRADGAPDAAVPLRLHTHTQKDYLAHLALFVQEKNQKEKSEEQRGLVLRRDVIDVLSRRHLEIQQRARPDLTEGAAREEMTEFLEYVADRTGLLIDRGGDVFSFIHLSFQEYLAAWVFTCTGACPAEFFEQRIGQQAWEEVLLLRLYILLNRGGGEAAFDGIVSHLFRVLEREDRAAAWLTLARAVRDNLQFRKVDETAVLERALSEWLKEPAFRGDWFDVLLEIKLFAEQAASHLRAILVKAVARRAPTEAIACLHLMTRLFGFPEDVVTSLVARADLVRFRADLCAFVGHPGATPLIVEAGPSEWATLLESLAAGDAYALTLEWMNAGHELPPAALLGAAAYLSRRVIVDFAARTAFASKHRTSPEAGALFTTGETLQFKGWGYVVEVPFGALRTPGKPLGSQAARSSGVACGGLLDPELLTLRSGKDERMHGLLARRMATLFGEQLDPFAQETPVDASTMEGLGRDFVRDFGRAFGRDFGRAFVRAFSHAFVRDFVRDFGRDFVRAFGSDFVRDFGRAFVRAFGRAFGRDFVRDFGRDFVHDFGVDLEAPDFADQWDRAMADDRKLSLALEDTRLWYMTAFVSSVASLADLPSSAGRPSVRLQNPFALPPAAVELWNAEATSHLLHLCRDLTVQFPDARARIPDNAVTAWLDDHPFEAFHTALVWADLSADFRERGVSLRGERGGLILAHAAYAACRFGFLDTGDAWTAMLAERDTTDPRIEAMFHLHKVACFEDTDVHVAGWRERTQNPVPELRPLLDAAGVVIPPPPPAKPAPPKEPPKMPAWFEGPPFPWSDPRADELYQVLLRAYSDVHAIELIGKRAGVLLGDFVATKGSGAAWQSLLDSAASQGKVRPLLEKVLADASVAAFHSKLRELSGLPSSARSTTALSLANEQGASPSREQGSSPSREQGASPSREQAPSPPTDRPAVVAAPPPEKRRKTPTEQVLFSWLHLSDIHVGHGNAAHKWNQERVLDALVADLKEHFGPSPATAIPAPEVVIVTGDVAFSGKTDQYAKAKARLGEIAAAVRLDLTRVLAVPGNHDVDRDADKDLFTRLSLDSARSGNSPLDALLNDVTGRAKIAGRMAAYASFERELCPVDAQSDRLFWRHSLTSAAGVPVRLFGLNTSLLAAADTDEKKLCLGEQQLHSVKSSKEELALLLTHHPFSWLSDGTTAAAHIAQHVDIHLSGHVHGAESQGLWGGSGAGLVRVVAGAVHHERLPPDVPESHGYNLAAVVRTTDDRIVLRVWPWKWQSQTQDFRADVANLPKNKPHAEHALPRIRLSAKAAG